VSIAAIVGLALAMLSTTLTNIAYLREHDAAAAMPALSLRRPLRSLSLLVEDRSWLRGFAMESTGFMLYAAALGLASLALVQSVAAGGIGVLAFVSARVRGRRLAGRERWGVALAVVGLAALAASLAAGGSASPGRHGSTVLVLIWLGATALVALAFLSTGRRLFGNAVAHGVAGGLFFSIGDISTKLATAGGARSAFVVTLIAGYLLGTTLLQVGYQSGGALTVAGIATLLTNAVPIVAGTVVLQERVPGGALGAVRVLAFVTVIVGALLLARPAADRSVPPA
jgi:hypothetical protein